MDLLVKHDSLCLTEGLWGPVLMGVWGLPGSDGPLALPVGSVGPFVDRVLLEGGGLSA